MKSKCPHCQKKGITFFSRFLVSISNIFSRSRLSAVCKYCNNHSKLPIEAEASKIQFIMVIFYFLTTPFLLLIVNKSTAIFVAYLSIASIIAIGYLIPLEQDNY